MASLVAEALVLGVVRVAELEVLGEMVDCGTDGVREERIDAEADVDADADADVALPPALVAEATEVTDVLGATPLPLALPLALALAGVLDAVTPEVDTATANG